MSKVFVTGATGFIGQHVCRALIAGGHETVGLVRNRSKIPEDLTDTMQWVEGDLAAFRREDFPLPPVDIVLHLAAVVAGKNLKEYDQVNFAATRDMCTWLEQQDWKPGRLIFASSLAAMGPSPGDHAWTEKDKPAPIDPYGQSKLDCETYLLQRPYPVTLFRPPIVMGPGDPAFLTMFRMTRSGFAVLPTGQPQTLSYIYVADLVAAIIAMVLQPIEGDSRIYFTTHDI